MMNEPLDIRIRHNSSASFNFRLVLFSAFTDRLAFYGLRSIVIIYAVYNLQIEEDQAFYYYGFYLLVTSIASLIGGIVSDFLTGPKPAMIVGISLCLIGASLSLIDDPSTYLTGMALILIGSGFYRASSFSFIGHISLNKHVLLEKRFILHYAAVSLGAFLSAILIGLMGEFYGYFLSLLTIASIYLISLLTVSFLYKSNINNDLSESSIPDEEVPSKNNIKFIILSIIGIALFWLIFELYGHNRAGSTIIYSVNVFGFELPRSLIYSVSSFCTLLLIIPYYFLAKRISTSLKLALGCLLIGSIWIIGGFLFSSNNIVIGLMPILLIGFIEGIVDLLVTPTMMTFICQYSPKKYYGTLFGIYSIIFLAGIKLGSFMAGIEISMKSKITLIVFLIGTSIFFILLPKEMKTERNTEAKNSEDLL